jgi:alpha-L-fucosidase
MAGAGPAMIVRRATAAQAEGAQIAPGPFRGTRESLKDYQVPNWYRDAKFGIWAHWGPESAPEFGDWYAQRMYLEGNPTYQYHLEHYGHPSKFGYKDICREIWKGNKFDPDSLMALYKKAGAKYSVSMGVHHDNFDMWKSNHQPRWNAAACGIKRDVVGEFRAAAEKQGLRFGVSEHLARSFNWYAAAHGSDKSGPYAGVSYDGNDPAYVDLYHDYSKAAPAPAGGRGIGNSDSGPDWWQRTWFNRIEDLVDRYQPELLYSDGRLPFESYGLSVVANLYNVSAKKHGGRVEAIYTSKLNTDCETGTCVLDLERTIVDRVWPAPWQTDTCVGNWHYLRGVKYKTPKVVVDMLVDIVSRNGNLLLNFPLPNSGELDAEELQIIEGITSWMNVNSEGIYGTRPWKIYGEGPTNPSAGTAGRGAEGRGAPAGGAALTPAEQATRAARFGERSRPDLTPQDVRFTTKGSTLYAFVMGWPDKEVVIRPLGARSPQGVGKIRKVDLLGFKGNLKWTQADDALRIEAPPLKPCDYAVTFKITGA